MKKILKNDLRLEKELIASLSNDDLTAVKGGAVSGIRCEKTEGCVHPVSYYPEECRTMDTCQISLCKVCNSLGGVTCVVPVTDLNTGCAIVRPVSEDGKCAIEAL